MKKLGKKEGGKDGDPAERCGGRASTGRDSEGVMGRKWLLRKVEAPTPNGKKVGKGA